MIPSFTPLRFLSPLFLAIALVSIANAQTTAAPSATPSTAPVSYDNPFIVPTTGFPSFTAGQPGNLSWHPTTQGTITIVLRSGNAGNLIAGALVAQKIPNSGSFTWTPDKSITQGNAYTLQIVNDANIEQVNYSPYFLISNPTNVVPTKTPAYTYGVPSSAVAAYSATASANSTKSGAGERLGIGAVGGGIAAAMLAAIL